MCRHCIHVPVESVDINHSFCFKLPFSSFQKHDFCPPYKPVFLPRQEVITRGLSPHRIWPFNTSLATVNEPEAASARLGPTDFAQMFISHSPAVLSCVFFFLFSLFIWVICEMKFSVMDFDLDAPSPFFFFFWFQTLCWGIIFTVPRHIFLFPILRFIFPKGAGQRAEKWKAVFPFFSPIKSFAAPLKFVIAILALSSCLSLLVHLELHWW